MELTRRRFFQALAASALAAGVPLPIGMPREPKMYVWHKSAVLAWDLHVQTLEWHFYAKRGGTEVFVSVDAPNTTQETKFISTFNPPSLAESGPLHAWED